jgi:superfamily II DNA or RNA helicase
MSVAMEVPTDAAVCSICGFPADDATELPSGGYACGFCAESLVIDDYEPTDSSAKMALRPYQQEAADGIDAAFQENDSTLAVMPTGTGKTIVLASVIHEWDRGRVLVMAHRDELIRQAADKIERVTGEPCDIEMGEYMADQKSLYNHAKVVVTSVQTMSRRNRHSRFHPEDFSLLIVDEAHHATAKTYRAVIEYFQQGGLKVLGVTATPDRTDEAALGQVFQSVAFEYALPQAIDDGWLVPIRQQFVEVEGLDFSEMKTTAGDLNQRQLAEAMEEEKTAHRIVSSTIEIANGEQTLIFTASVDQAEEMAMIANRHRLGCAEWICGDAVKCPMEIRRQTLGRFRNRDFQFLFNCSVLLEGFDQDNIGVVVPKATKSRSLYAQMIGRGTRPLSGLVDGIESADDRRSLIAASSKPHMLALDFVGNSGRHKLINTGDMLGGNYDDDIVAEATRAAASKSSRGERSDMLAELRIAEEARKEKLRKQREGIVAKAKYRLQSVDPFDVFDIMPKREPAWHRGRKPTERMAAAVERMGMDTSRMTYWQAHQIIEEAGKRREKNLCSFKQAKLLRKHGFAADCTFQEASTTIDRIAKSGWKLKRPAILKDNP